ncbi:MAG: transposase [Treponema sp.]|jgi:REP element-mobilizing transposase RayT|nr:transposase [Treponema sp.]
MSKRNNRCNRRRQLRQGVSYHVGWKINRDEIIFDNDFIVTLFYDIIRRCKEKYEFSIENIEIMGNHTRFILTPKKKVSLPKIMQWIASVFAKSYNKTMGISGRLWKERYFSKIIETVEQLVNTFEYFKKDPLTTNLGKRDNDYRNNGLYHYLHKIKGIIDPQEAMGSTSV